MEENKETRVKQLRVVENEDVYDLQIEGNHNFFANGILVHNCGEIFMHEDSCRLIHVNLSSFVDNPFTDKAKLNDSKLYEVTYEAMRLGDDLVYLEEQAIKKILKKIENDGEKGNSEYRLYERLLHNSLQGRRCGLGFLGMSDAIAELGLKYDSDEALDMIGHIMDVMFIAEMDCQIDMALTRGSFPAFNKALEENVGNEWYDMLKKDYPELYKKNMLYGRRNISFNTVAPTGTVSLMAKSSSGIEPVFMPYYTRRVKCMNDSDKVDFVDQNGEKFTEYVVVHPPMKKWAEANYGDISEWKQADWENAFKNSPWFGSTAQEIDWVQRVKLQGAVQQRITHSISSCVVAETLIETENGGYLYIDELTDFSNIKEGEFKKNETDLTVKTHLDNNEKVLSFYNNGKKDVFNIELLNGLNVTCTSNERFLIYDEDKESFEWKMLCDIKEGDIIKT